MQPRFDPIRRKRFDPRSRVPSCAINQRSNFEGLPRENAHGLGLRVRGAGERRTALQQGWVIAGRVPTAARAGREHIA